MELPFRRLRRRGGAAVGAAPRRRRARPPCAPTAEVVARGARDGPHRGRRRDPRGARRARAAAQRASRRSTGLTLANAPGLIDAGYRGEVVCAVGEPGSPASRCEIERGGPHRAARDRGTPAMSPAWVDELPIQRTGRGRLRLDGPRVIVRLETPGRTRRRRSRSSAPRSARPRNPTIVEAVRDQPGSFALVAEEDGDMVGHVQLSRGMGGGGRGPGAGTDRGDARAPGRRHRDGARAPPRSRGARAGGGRRRSCSGRRATTGPRLRAARAYGLANPFAGDHRGRVRDRGGGLPAGRRSMRIGVASLAGEVRWHPAFG